MNNNSLEMECQELKCCVCDQDYSDDHVPRNLRCGHSVCSTCLDLLIPISKRCPECRDNFVENGSSELPINYPLLRLSRIFAHKKMDPNILPELKFPVSYSSSECQQDAGKCPSHGCSLFFMCMRCGVWVCRDCLVVDHPDSPRGRCFILSVGDAIAKIKKSHISAIDKCIADGNTVRKKLERDLRILTIILKNIKDLEEINNKNEAVVASVSTLDALTKSLKEAREKLSEANSPKMISTSMKESTDCQSTFDKYLGKEKEREIPNILNILLDGKDLKETVKSGKPVYVVNEKEGKDRWASVVFKVDRIHLYSLRDGIPPEGGFNIPFELVRDLVPKESPAMFLEVGRGGEIKGHVYVRMFGDTPRSRQTLYLCSGERGPSYRNTCFYDFVNTSDNCQLLAGGDYENNDGSGGRAIVEGIVSGEPYAHEVKPGLFVSWPAHEHWRLGSFDIYLDGPSGLYDYSAHGIIEQGLEILKEAAKINPVTDTSVVDCGLVIPT